MRASRATTLIAMAAVASFTLSACGDGSTADNEGESAGSVPSVSASASEDAGSGEDSADSSEGDDANREDASADSSDHDSRDGSVEEVEDIPGQERSDEESGFLTQLTENDVQLDKLQGEDRSAWEDQLLATAHSYCQDPGANGYLVDAVAGQLQTQGLVNKDEKDPEANFTHARDTLRAAADEKLCG